MKNNLFFIITLSLNYLIMFSSCENTVEDRKVLEDKIDSLLIVDSLNNYNVLQLEQKSKSNELVIGRLKEQIKSNELVIGRLKEQINYPNVSLVNNVDSVSYSIGADIGDNLINQGIEINYGAFNEGFSNGYEKEEHLLTMEKRRKLFKSMQDRMRVKQQAEASKALEKAENFLKDNKDKNKDILVTKSGLQYRVIKKGSGKSPDSSSDQVRVHYEGKLLDGTIFDSSYKKGEPFVTRLNRVIKGWTEGIQLMNEGSEYEFFIHPRLAYGARRNNDIPPNSILIFKVELQKVFDKNIK